MRFAVLTHDHPRPHFDLLVETGPLCRTWRLAGEPDGPPVAAEPIADHRPHYLTYEGPVSGGRGTVARWDAGRCTAWTEEGGAVRLTLDGERLRGAFEIDDQFRRVR